MRPRNAFRNRVFGASKLASAKTPLLNPCCRLHGTLSEALLRKICDSNLKSLAFWSAAILLPWKGVQVTKSQIARFETSKRDLICLSPAMRKPLMIYNNSNPSTPESSRENPLMLVCDAQNLPPVFQLLHPDSIFWIYLELDITLQLHHSKFFGVN